MPSDDERRDRIALVLYGDGNDLSWATALRLADIVTWELDE